MQYPLMIEILNKLELGGNFFIPTKNTKKSYSKHTECFPHRIWGKAKMCTTFVFI